MTYRTPHPTQPFNPRAFVQPAPATVPQGHYSPAQPQSIQKPVAATSSSFDIGRVLRNFVTGALAAAPQIIGAGVLLFLAMGVLGTLGDTIRRILFESGHTSIAGLVALAIFALYAVGLVAIYGFCVLATEARISGRAVAFRSALGQALRGAVPLALILLAYAVCVALGSVALVLPGLVVASGWAVSAPVYMVERTAVFQAFTRSWFLTRGAKAWVFLIRTVVGTLTLAVALGIQFLEWRASGRQVGFDGGDIDLPMVITVTTFLGTLLMALALFASMSAAIYVECRRIRDGGVPQRIGHVFH